LSADGVPACQLTRSKEFTPHLGWNTWLFSTPPTRDVDDSRFKQQEIGVPVTV
jgi:predicted component of type VI protein secretion system